MEETDRVIHISITQIEWVQNILIIHLWSTLEVGMQHKFDLSKEDI